MVGVLALLALSATAAEAGVKTMTVPSTVVRKLRNPRTVTVGRAVCTTTLLLKWAKLDGK